VQRFPESGLIQFAALSTTAACAVSRQHQHGGRRKYRPQAGFQGNEEMTTVRMNSAIRVLFGAAAVVGVTAVALPASAATATIHDATATAAESYNASTGDPSLTKNSITIGCGISFGLANIATVGTAYTIPPATVMGKVASATFTSGSALCTSVVAEALPWDIEVTSVTSSTTADVTVEGVEFYNPAVGYCGPTNLSGTYDSSTNTLTIPAFTMVGTDPAGTCTSDSAGVVLTVTSGLITFTYP
jgi:hypothetical protein